MRGLMVPCLERSDGDDFEERGSAFPRGVGGLDYLGGVRVGGHKEERCKGDRESLSRSSGFFHVGDRESECSIKEEAPIFSHLSGDSHNPFWDALAAAIFVRGGEIVWVAVEGGREVLVCTQVEVRWEIPVCKGKGFAQQDG